MFGPIKIAPSILSADFCNLGRDVRLVLDAGADWIHVDVMDGHFVPNLTIGPPHVKALRSITDAFLDVHLMIDNPDAEIPWFIEAGADSITVHAEVLSDPLATLGAIKDAGVKCAVSINPPTPPEAIRDLVGIVDMVLVMSVNPGFSGQSFMESSIGKVAKIALWAAEAGASPLIQVDGGMNVDTVPLVAAKGADVIVAGNAVYKASDPAIAIAALRAAAQSAQPARR